MPKPRFALNESVCFNWSTGRMCGPVSEIDAFVEQPLDTFGNLPIGRVEECTSIYITVYAKGHSRWLSEKRATRL